MARGYSLDLRERVVALVSSGQSCRAVAAHVAVGAASVAKWPQRDRTTGSPAPKPMGGGRPYLLAGERDWLLTPSFIDFDRSSPLTPTLSPQEWGEETFAAQPAMI